MGGGVRPRDHIVECLNPHADGGKNTDLAFKLDGAPGRVSVQVGKLSQQLLNGLSERAVDLLEIASLVYAADALVRRGGTVMRQMGKQWHRRFIVKMSVRDITVWQDPGVKRALEGLLLFLSDDRFEFEFVERTNETRPKERYFAFDAASAWQPNRVLMFSGGLDSFSGALEEIVDQGHRVALVSHFSSTKIAPVQRDLVAAIREKLGTEVARHYTIKVQIPNQPVIEGTHRTRSFLFAVLGAIVADLFELDRVSFHENGVVSLNLPPVGNVQGARATRTTHPKSLALFTGLIGKVFQQGMRVNNPLFWKTKTEVVETIRRLGFEDHISNTHSCADVHNRTKQYLHCGRCSQCIDRRFAMLAAGLQVYDPADAYRLDLMTGERDQAMDREIGLSYIRNALFFEFATAQDILRAFPAVVEAISYLGESAEAALKRITGLLQRHGASVSGVMRSELGARGHEDLPLSTLPRLYVDDEAARLTGPVGESQSINVALPESKVVLAFDRQNQVAILDEALEIRSGATHQLLWALAEKHLQASGQGLAPLDYPFTTTAKLAHRLGREGDAAIRQLVSRARSHLKSKLVSAGKDGELGQELIENSPWHGYRLNPDLVEVRVKQ